MPPPRNAGRLHCLLSVVLPNIFPTDMKEDAARKVVNALTLLNLPRFRIVFKEGDIPDGFYAIVTGALPSYGMAESILNGDHV